MDSAETVHRVQFAFTVTFHYLFPQLTMGLALLLTIWRWIAWRRDDERARRAVRFWGGILAITFVLGVATGIPLEMQLGTSWARLSKVAGGAFGQALAMEGIFAFFLEATFLGLFLFGERRMSERSHVLVTTGLFVGTWLSGYFIVSANAWMQHPVGTTTAPDGTLVLDSVWSLLTNPWAVPQYLHTMCGAVVTGAFVVAGVGAFYLLHGVHAAQARLYVKTGVIAGLVAVALSAFPTGDVQAQNTRAHKPEAFAAMEGVFRTQAGAPIVLVGQPDVERMRLDNPIEIPRALSFLTYRRFDAEVTGLADLPRDRWPDNIPLLYYAYHVMVGLGTILLALAALAAWKLARGTLYASRTTLWLLLLAVPFPYVANTAGWMTAELGRQPWVVHGLLRTRDAFSSNVSAGNALFSLIGFCGLYAFLAILFLFLVLRRIGAGPDPESDGRPVVDPPPPLAHPGA